MRRASGQLFKELYTAAEMANKWNCDPHDIKDWAAAGMPYTKNGKGQYMFDLKECQKWWAGGHLEKGGMIQE